MKAVSPLFGTGAAGAAAVWASAAAAVAANTAPTSPARNGVLKFIVGNSWTEGSRGSEGVAVGFAGADANGLLDRRDEDLAVTDLAGPGCGGDRLDHLADELIR